jgi:ribonuclease Z
MSRIVFLGTSAAVGSKIRDNTSLLISAEKQIFLIDAPGSLPAKLDKINIDFRKIRHVFLTHTHPDHIYGIINLIHSRYCLRDVICLYGHKKTLETVKSLLKLLDLNDTKKYPKIYFKPVKINSKPFYQSWAFCLWAIPAVHTPESMGLKIYFKEYKISCVFSSDTAYNKNLIDYASDCDYLIHDCAAPQRIFNRYAALCKMHTSSLMLGKIAATLKAKITIPIHFITELKYSISEIRQEIKKNYTGKIIIPYDMMTLKLKTKS